MIKVKFGTQSKSLWTRNRLQFKNQSLSNFTCKLQMLWKWIILIFIIMRPKFKVKFRPIREDATLCVAILIVVRYTSMHQNDENINQHLKHHWFQILRKYNTNYCRYFNVAQLTFRSSDVKADMKSYIPLETAAIFFSGEPFSKTRYYLAVCHGWFHLHGLTRPVRNANRELQKGKFMPTVGFEPGTCRLQSERVKRWAIGDDKYRSPRGERILLELSMSITCTTRSPGFTCDIFRNYVVYFSHIIFVSFCCLTYFRRLLTVNSYENE